MVDNTKVLMMDGHTTLAETIANINAKSSEPIASVGPGEVIYRTDLKKLYVNTGTAISPIWELVGAGGGFQSRIYIGDLDTYLERDSAAPNHLIIHCNGIDFE